MKIILILLVLGVVGAFIWKTSSQDQEPIVTQPVVEELTQPAAPAIEQSENVLDIPEVPVEASIPMDVDTSMSESVQEPIVTDKSAGEPLTEEEKVFYTKQRDEAEKVIKESLSKYMESFSDPVKRAEIDEFVRVKHKEYSEAVSKLDGQ